MKTRKNLTVLTKAQTTRARLMGIAIDGDAQVPGLVQNVGVHAERGLACSVLEILEVADDVGIPDGPAGAAAQG